MTLALHMLQRVHLQKFEVSRPAGLGEVLAHWIRSRGRWRFISTTATHYIYLIIGHV
jgi:hypothetical protein